VLVVVRVAVAVGVRRAMAVCPRRGLGVVLLGGEEVGAEGAGELEVGPESARLADDRGAAGDDVPVDRAVS
jgi:hypothetical protein